jgi:hypothetical protein
MNMLIVITIIAIAIAAFQVRNFIVMDRLIDEIEGQKRNDMIDRIMKEARTNPLRELEYDMLHRVGLRMKDEAQKSMRRAHAEHLRIDGSSGIHGYRITEAEAIIRIANRMEAEANKSDTP